jgi:S1-C subfamily serine protease
MNLHPTCGLHLTHAPDGLRVVAVEPASGAARLGVQPGDVLLKAHYVPLAGPGLLARHVRENLSGETLVHLRDHRSGKVVVLWLDFGNGVNIVQEAI